MKRPLLHRGGFTLIEMMLASIILSILVLAVAPVFNMTQRGFTSVEARNALKTSGQEAVNRLSHKMVECKRLFENTAVGNAYLALIQRVEAPATLADSRLPSLEETGSVTPSSGTFVPASVGNSLFFASVDRPRDLTVNDSGGDTQIVRVDTYVFNYYFLSQDDSITIGGQPGRRLWEWHSGLYADYNQIVGITDATTQANVVAALQSGGIPVAWDPSSTSAGAAFHTLNANGSITLVGDPEIAERWAAEMIVIRRAATGSYRHGVSPNTGAESAHPVPHFAAADDAFPSGFEIVAVGPNSARQVFVRLVLAAEGSFGGGMTSEQVSLATVRDLW